MTTERRQQVREIFSRAVRLGPEAREAFLAEVCEGDEALLDDVKSLIASEQDEKATSINSSENKQTISFYEQTLALAPGEIQPLQSRRIGAYQILGEVGSGGMGFVYLAARADDEFDRRVAIKVVKTGMDTDFVVRRFRTERQILANLDHSNIARLIDGGTTDNGLPYFVMEYVEGQPILDYCDARQLSTAERLKIFRKVCAAIHYAHQNLIVHRDIKPNNILVTAEGEPKLLDFGIAKLLAATGQAADVTHHNMRLMTPAYASPEQVKGESITTASDVYSLGVLLYELLTGHRPYQVSTSSFAHMVKVICEQEPEKPSTIINRADTRSVEAHETGEALGPGTFSKPRDSRPEKLKRELSGDLDNIALKAIRKEPQHRYASAEQLAEDIRRYLEGLPVAASEGTLKYRAGKFIRRHRSAVIAAGLVFITLIAGIIGTTSQALIAGRERAKSERRFNDVRRLANSFMFEFHDSIQDLQGATPARELVVKRALEYLDNLAGEAGGDVSLQRELATAYQKVGDVQGDPYASSLGDTSSALESYRKALAIRERLSAADPSDKDVRSELATSDLKVGDILWVQGDWNGALDFYQKALAIQKEIQAVAPDDGIAYDLSVTYQAIGDTLMQMGNLSEALANQQTALAIREEMSKRSDDSKVRLGLATSYIKSGDVLTKAGKMAECLEAYNKGIAIVEGSSKTDPANAKIKRVLKSAYQRLGLALEKNGDARKAIELYKSILVMDEKSVAADPSDAVARRGLLGDYLLLANTLSVNEEVAESIAYYEKALALALALSRDDPNNAQAQNDLLAVYLELGRTLEESGKLADAEKHYRKATGIAESLLAVEPGNAASRTDLARCYLRLGRLRVQMGDEDESLKLLRKSLELRDARAKEDPSNADAQYDLAGAYFYLGYGYEHFGANAGKPPSQRLAHWKEARDWYQRSLDLYVNMRDSGMLAEAQASDIEDTVKQIARCDEAINRLKGAN
ncbi:MAG TPA: protein kinase [Blastocatellia bacterium]|jgi:serine/threonine protein kinase/predicted negative regulator of RcsB-dependent stress response|nr:protein kinase [Blastocatellia bacterium]